MKLFRYIRDLFSRDTSSPAQTVRAGVIPLWNDLPATDAMKISTVYRCVDLLSTSVANLPLLVMRRKNGLFVESEADNLPYLLNVQPDVAINAVDFWRQVVTEVLTHGNAYIVPFYSPALGGYYRFALCKHGTVTHDTMTDSYTVNDFVTGVSGTYGEEDMIHIKGLPGADPKTGLSVLAYARQTTGTALAGDVATLERFRNGGDVRGIIGNDRSLRGFGKFQSAELRKAAEEMDYMFNRSGAKVISMPDQVDWHQLSMTSADMQFLESRKFTVREICRFFGVHPSFVFDDTSNNYKSAEMANVAFLSNTLNPLLRRIEVELLRKLFPARLAKDRRVIFDRRELYACDLDSKARYTKSRIECGLSTVNEARAMENLCPVEGGDTVLVSANLKGVAELGGAPAQITQ